MTTSGEDLTQRVADEIRALRKGRGLQTADLDSRLGPLLLELAGSGDAADRRKTVLAAISRCTEQLSGEYRAAVEASLALSQETMQEPFFTRRVTWLAGYLDREYRTALRRINQAELRLAELIATELRDQRGRIPDSAEGFYVDELRTLLRLDTQILVSEEDRRIVSTRQDLTEVTVLLDLPRAANEPEADLQAEIRYGGHLLRKQQPSPNRFKFVLRLPEALQPGQVHGYGLSLRMPRHMLRLPHYLVTPECQYNRFDLRIRFDPERLPAWIRRVEGETVRQFEDAQPTARLLVPDAAGEVRQEFRDLTMFLGYGMQWKPVDLRTRLRSAWCGGGSLSPSSAAAKSRWAASRTLASSLAAVSWSPARTLGSTCAPDRVHHRPGGGSSEPASAGS
jgi:hypothetical protein